MGVLDFPRLHFFGVCIADVPTGNNNNNATLNTATLEIFKDGENISNWDVEKYREFSRTNGNRYDAAGVSDKEGSLSNDQGFNVTGTNAVKWQCTIQSAESEPGELSTTDPVVGQPVLLMGHFNPYTKSTINPARIVDADMSSNFTPNVLAGLFSIGAGSATEPVGVGFQGPICTAWQAARWLSFEGFVDVDNMKEDPNKPDYMGSAVFQFAVRKPDTTKNREFKWGEKHKDSDILRKFEATMQNVKCQGFIVRYSLFNMASTNTGGPAALNIAGTIAPWMEGELQTQITARYLVPSITLPKPQRKLGPMAFKIKEGKLYVSMLNTVPWTGRKRHTQTGVPNKLYDKVYLGDLEFCANIEGKEVIFATLPFEKYNQASFMQNCGHVQVDIKASDDILKKLHETDIYMKGLTTKFASKHKDSKTPPERQKAEPLILLEELAVVIQTDTGNVWTEAYNEQAEKETRDNPEKGILYCLTDEHKEILEKRSEAIRKSESVDEFNKFAKKPNPFQKIHFHVYKHGKPVANQGFYLHQYYNVLGFPNVSPVRDNSDFCVGLFRTLHDKEWKPSVHLTSDAKGEVSVFLKGYKSGAARVYMSLESAQDAPPLQRPSDEVIKQCHYNSYQEWQYDDFAQTGFWTYANCCSIRVLPNDWELYYTNINKEEISWEFIKNKVLKWYDMLYPFMSAHVFALTSEPKVYTYADLIMGVTNADHIEKTFYMPPTRELSQGKRLLLHKYCMQAKAKGTPPIQTPEKEEQGKKGKPKFFENTRFACREITTREHLLYALTQAIDLEHSLLVQYLFAVYSLPTFEQATKLGWDKEHIAKVCGDGTLGKAGWRGTILNICYQEMFHFLLANNLLQAAGGSPHVTISSFPRPAKYYPLDVLFALEPFSDSTLQRFIHFEWPNFKDYKPGEGMNHRGDALKYNTVAELYVLILKGFEHLQEDWKNDPKHNSPAVLYPQGKKSARGTWNIFMSRAFQNKYPNYDGTISSLEDVKTAIELIIEQGEGSNPKSPDFHISHFEKFREINKEYEALKQKYTKPEGPDWVPSYHMLSNPTLSLQRDLAEGANRIVRKEARMMAKLFNMSYETMLLMLTNTFSGTDEVNFRLGKLFNLAIDVMIGVMKPLAEHLVVLDSGVRGLKAGPTFELEAPIGYIPVGSVSNAVFLERFLHLKEYALKLNATNAKSGVQVNPNVIGIFETIANQLRTGITGSDIPPLSLTVADFPPGQSNNSGAVVTLSLADMTALCSKDQSPVEISFGPENNPKKMPCTIQCNEATPKGQIGVPPLVRENLGITNNGEKITAKAYPTNPGNPVGVPPASVIEVRIAGAVPQGVDVKTKLVQFFSLVPVTPNTFYDVPIDDNTTVRVRVHVVRTSQSTTYVQVVHSTRIDLVDNDEKHLSAPPPAGTSDGKTQTHPTAKQPASSKTDEVTNGQAPTSSAHTEPGAKRRKVKKEEK